MQKVYYSHPYEGNTAKGSHIHVTSRSVCDRDQNGIKRSTFFFWSRSRDQDEFWATNIKRSTHFLRYHGGVAIFCPL